MQSDHQRKLPFPRHIALPQDQGSWVFLFSPLLIGLFAGGKISLPSIFLIIAALAAFLIRQPVTIATKAYSGRRSLHDLRPAWFWITVYGLVGAAALAGLVWLGFGYLLILALPGIPVFLWHLILVSKRAERRQMGVEVVGSGVLALIAPAAYWVGVGSPASDGWWLFVLTWLQSAASIVYAYLRLEQRTLTSLPDRASRFRMAWRALAYTTINLLLTLGFSAAGTLPSAIPVPFLLQWIETVWGTLNPAIGVKPTRIGIRQLIISSLFTILFIIAWLLP